MAPARSAGSLRRSLETRVLRVNSRFSQSASPVFVWTKERVTGSGECAIRRLNKTSSRWLSLLEELPLNVTTRESMSTDRVVGTSFSAVLLRRTRPLSSATSRCEFEVLGQHWSAPAKNHLSSSHMERQPVSMTTDSALNRGFAFVRLHSAIPEPSGKWASMSKTLGISASRARCASAMVPAMVARIPAAANPRAANRQYGRSWSTQRTRISAGLNKDSFRSVDTLCIGSF